jgi:CDP-4-dehydro-6-deoxyglucose reductase
MGNTVGLVISIAEEPARDLLFARPLAPERLVDLLDEAGETVGWLACRSARCGACLLSVGAGAALLIPPDPAETDTLIYLGAAPGQRLGCQLVVVAGARGQLVVTPRGADGSRGRTARD